MGEIADMMLEGEMCEGCGEFLDNDEVPGFPMYCSTKCAKDRGVPKKDWPYAVVGYSGEFSTNTGVDLSFLPVREQMDAARFIQDMIAGLPQDEADKRAAEIVKIYSTRESVK